MPTAVFRAPVRWRRVHLLGAFLLASLLAFSAGAFAEPRPVPVCASTPAAAASEPEAAGGAAVGVGGVQACVNGTCMQSHHGGARVSLRAVPERELRVMPSGIVEGCVPFT